MSLFEIKNLEKTYRVGEVETHALQGVDLTINKGEFSAIAGPSGSGKSTLLHLMGGLDTPTSGAVYLNDKRIDQLSKGEAAKVRLNTLGFVFQAYNLIPVLTALENAAFVLELRGVGKQAREARALESLKALGMEAFADRHPNQLSGGQQQRVAVARAFAAKPDIILADEPTANLDSKSGGDLIELMKRLNEDEGVTFVFSTHDPRLLAHVNRTVNIEDGRILHEETLQAA